MKTPKDIIDIDLLREKHERNEKILIHAYNSIKEKETALKELNDELTASKEELQQQLAYIHKTQKALVESEKMAALGNLVAGVAHEVNTPLGNSYTLITLLQDELRDCQTKFLERSLSAADLEKFLGDNTRVLSMATENLRRAAELIKNFKMLAVDQSTENVRKIKLHEYSKEIILSLYNIRVDNRHNIELECNSEISLITNPGYFAQILSNLIQNAVIHAFGPDQSGNILIKIFQTDSHVHIQVSDDGKGIQQENLSHIFEPFFTTNRGAGGSGLGLHIVYNLVHQKFGGSISCDSSPGDGCSFEIVIPLDKDQQTT